MPISAELSSLTLGGYIKSWDSSGDAAYLHYTIDDDINGFIALSETWVSGGDRYFQEDPGDAVDLSGLTPGSHTLAVWFEVKDTDPDPELSVWDSRGGANYNATFTIADDTALPVEVTDFSARCLQHAVELTWRTASENGEPGLSHLPRRRAAGRIGRGGDEQRTAQLSMDRCLRYPGRDLPLCAGGCGSAGKRDET
ncbi:MAG: hypothetical protein U5N56_03670 [Candidatus Marinimicrobia bacterium]|nr:hypothetical protein [Candidatus Neomarinimicrobiota bacterium]